MAIQTQNFATIVGNAVTAIQGASKQLVDMTIGSVLRAFVEAVAAIALWLQGIALQIASLTRFATSNGADADSWAADFGFARLAAQQATGQVTFARFTSTTQVVVPLASVVQTADGSQKYTVIADTNQTAYSATLGGYVMAAGVTSCVATVKSVNAAAAANAAIAAINTLGQAIAGVDTVTNAAAFTTGADAETDAAFRSRFVGYINSLSKATRAAIGNAILAIQQGINYTLTEGIFRSASKMSEIPASNSVKIPSMKSESLVVDRNSGSVRLQPPLQYQPSKIVLADLNVDPPDSDGNDSVPVAAVSPICLSRVIADEICQDKLKKDIEIAETEGKQLKKLGKCRSRMGKLECPPDCNGADAEADHNVHGVPSSREEKVSSLKTGLIHVARKMPKNAHAHFVLGLMYQRMGQPQKAILAYEKSEEILVRSEEAIDRPELLSLVQVHHAQCILLGTLEDCSSDEELDPEELENILAKLKEVVKSDVRQASIWNALGIILLRSGRLQSAISVFSTLLDISPDNLDCLSNLGIACLQSGNLELSEKCFQDLLIKDQNHPTALINYAALILYKYGSLVAGAGANTLYGTSADQVTAANVAKECLLAALKADSKAAHIWTNLANAYYLMGDHRSSAKCLEKAGKIDPNCLATRYAVGVHRIRDAERSQNPNEQLSWAGIEMASILREGDSTSIEPPVAWAGLAMVHRAQHEIVAGFEVEHNELVEVKEHAIYSLKQAIAEDPADAVQWHQLGLHSLCTQQFKTSQTYLKAAVARRKDCTYAWSNLGISLQLSEESSQAESVYKQALSLATPKQAHTIFSNLGNLYRQLKQYECAKAMFNKSLELQPGYAPALNNLGLVYVAEGKWNEAKDSFDKAIQADPLLDAAKSNMIKASNMLNMYTSMS